MQTLPDSKFRGTSPMLFFLASCCAVALLSGGCDKDPKSNANGGRGGSNQRDIIPAPATRPVFEFADGLQSEHADVCAFVNEFLNTCLAGDYTGYRRLVTKRREPEPKERFQAIYYAIRSVSIDSIALQRVHDLPEPTYLVKATVSLDPDSRVAMRGSDRQIAILAFQENGEWRMAPAPAGLQPSRMGEDPTASAPASAPSYPWEADGDY